MPNQNACDTFLENFSHYDIQEMHEVTFHTAQSFISMLEARGKAAIHEENSKKRFLSNRGTVDDFQPQSRLKPLALTHRMAYRVHIGVVGFL